MLTLRTASFPWGFHHVTSIPTVTEPREDSMKTKFAMITVALGMVGLAACGGGDKGKMKKMKDAMCACKDAACVDKVQKDYADFMKSMEEKYKGDKKPDEDMMKIGEEMAKCMSDAMAGGAGGASDTGGGSASASGGGSASASGGGSASGSDTGS